MVTYKSVSCTPNVSSSEKAELSNKIERNLTAEELKRYKFLLSRKAMNYKQLVEFSALRSTALGRLSEIELSSNALIRKNLVGTVLSAKELLPTSEYNRYSKLRSLRAPKEDDVKEYCEILNHIETRQSRLSDYFCKKRNKR